MWQRWFGIHSPPPRHPLWSALGDGRDIIIHGQLVDAAPYRLACRDYLAQRWRARLRDEAEWADWYSALRLTSGYGRYAGQRGNLW